MLIMSMSMSMSMLIFNYGWFLVAGFWLLVAGWLGCRSVWFASLTLTPILAWISYCLFEIIGWLVFFLCSNYNYSSNHNYNYNCKYCMYQIKIVIVIVIVIQFIKQLIVPTHPPHPCKDSTVKSNLFCLGAVPSVYFI